MWGWSEESSAIDVDQPTLPVESTVCMHHANKKCGPTTEMISERLDTTIGGPVRFSFTSAGGSADTKFIVSAIKSMTVIATAKIVSRKIIFIFFRFHLLIFLPTKSIYNYI